jgi:1,2-diacylglycerol 3-alpha-glucosyltransferase
MLTDNEIKSTNRGSSVSYCAVAVLWIDWYAYHISRFAGLCQHPRLSNRVAGIEMVGGVGVHQGLKFREPVPKGMPVTTLFPEGSWGALSKWKIAQAVWSELNRLNPQTVLVPGYYNVPALASALWARLKRRRSVLMTESTEDDHQRIWWREFAKSLIIRGLFQWAIAGGEAHLRYLKRLGFPVERVGRFYDVVDNEFFWNRAQSERLRHRAYEVGLPERFFLYVGRLAEEKNISKLLAAYQGYRERGGTWSLVLVGGGPEETKLKEVANRSEFRHDIHFEGLKTSGELAPYYAFASCFVLPSIREPWGLVVNEAMAAGLPVIVSTACGSAEDLVITGENGFVFDPHSVSELEQCLTRVTSLSAGEWRAMASASAARIAQYSPAAWAEEVARVAGL